MEIQKYIHTLSEQFLEEVVECRHTLHQFPELSFRETQTSRFIKEQLEKTGIPYQSGYAETGILGWIEGKNPGKKVIALRSDMDALPVQEETGFTFQSKHEGVMHACGHDVHMANLLGVAKVLHALRESFEGTVLLVFQPGEEKLPGGARYMLEEGVFDNRTPDVVIAQHVDPELPLGTVGFKPGIYMASADEIYLEIKGEGGHAAVPEQISDPVSAATQIISNLYQLFSRKSPSTIPSVLSFGRMEANGATNIIPDSAYIEGTFRAMDERWRERWHEYLEATVQNIAAVYDCTGETSLVKGYPCLINDEQYTKLARQYALDFLEKDAVKDLEMKMIAEDFAYFSQQYPSVMYRLGTRDPQGPRFSLHSAKYAIDDQVLASGIPVMAWLTWRFLMDDPSC